MADIDKIKEFLNSTDKLLITSILIDELGYSVAHINDITDDTLETDDIIIAYSIDVIKSEVVETTHYIPLVELEGEDTVVATTHYITLAELEGADTVVFGKDEVMGVFN